MKRTLALVSLALLAGLAGCKASGPGNFETEVAREVKKNITIGGKDWKNPLPDTQATIQEGAEHFQHHCEVCHGLDGHATGVPFANKMDPPVPDLASKDIQGYTDGQLKWIIQNGIGPSGMPGWNGILEDEEMWAMVRYIRHLPAAGSLGAPKVYAEAEEQHQQEEGQQKTPASGKQAPAKHHHMRQH